MDDGLGRRRGARLAAVVTTVAGIALLAACGGGGSTSSQGSTYYQKAVSYAKCMRSHGVPSFPDPDSQGHFPPLQVGRDGVSQQTVSSAEQACQKLRPAGGTGGAQQQQAKLADGLAFARCMRAHGVPNFPDPSASNGGIGYDLSGVDTHSPQYQTANRTCQSQSGTGKPSVGATS
jgi:hypothetical protein